MGIRASKQQVKVDHFLFGKVTLKNQFNKQLITYHQKLLRTDQFIQWEAKYKEAVAMTKQSLLLPQSYDKMKIQKYLMCCQCPADMEMALTFQKFDFTLEKQIHTRKQSPQGIKYFTQNELFYFMYKLLQGCKQFQLRNMKVGDIKSSKVVKTKRGEIKLINTASFPLQYTPIQRILDQLDNKNTFYLAPEQITFLKSKGYGNDIYPNSKTEAFSLGLTILECANLTLSSDLYEKPPSRELNSDELQFRLKRLQQRYRLLPVYLRKICQINPDNRLTTGQMWSILKPYSANICQIKQFSPKQTAERSELSAFKNTLAKLKIQKQPNY